ncbi:unnamed protein product, partial [Allacma fusca]
NGERKYLDADMNIIKMHKLYCEKELLLAMLLNQRLSTYRQVFLQTGLKIGLPKSVTCEKCDLLHRRLREISISNHTGIYELEAEIEAHYLKADSAYSNLRIDTQLAKASSDVLTLCIDMQQQTVCVPYEGDNEAVHPIIIGENLSRNTVMNLQFTSAYNARFDVPERKVSDIRSLLRFLSSEERIKWTDLLPTLVQTQRPDPRPEAIADHSYSVQSLRAQEDHNYI